MLFKGLHVKLIFVMDKHLFRGDFSVINRNKTNLVYDKKSFFYRKCSLSLEQTWKGISRLEKFKAIRRKSKTTIGRPKYIVKSEA